MHTFCSFCLPSGLWVSSPARQTHSLWGWCRCSRCWAPASGAPPRWASVQWRWGAYGLSPAYASYREETERDSKGNSFLLVNFRVFTCQFYTEINILFYMYSCNITYPVSRSDVWYRTTINLIHESQEFLIFYQRWSIEGSKTQRSPWPSMNYLESLWHLSLLNKI